MMAKTINYEDFRKDGFIDFAALKTARIDVGELCRDCGAYMPDLLTINEQNPRTCKECVVLATIRGDVEHSSKVRCPACGYITYALEQGLCQGAGGKALLTCRGCGNGFEVEVWRRYTFVSPARLNEKSNGVVNDVENDQL